MAVVDLTRWLLLVSKMAVVAVVEGRERRLFCPLMRCLPARLPSPLEPLDQAALVELSRVDQA